MDFRGSKSLISLFFISLLVVTITGSVVAESTVYGLPVSEGILLFGNGTPDHDNQPFTDDQLNDTETSGGTSVDEILHEATIKWDRPLESVETWNNNNFEAEIESTRPSDESIAPEEANVAGSGYIKHAHGTIYSVDPAGIAHYHNRTERYVRANGTVRSQVDFLVDVPQDDYDSNPSGKNTLSIRWEYTLEKASVTRYELRADEEVVDEANGNTGVSSHISGTELVFNGISEGTETLSINAKIESSINEKITTKKRVYYRDEDGNRKSKIETFVTNNKLRDSIVVTDKREITVEQLNKTDFGVFELPDGSTTTVINAPQPFSRFEIGGETASDGLWGRIFGTQEDTPPDEIQTDWTFISTRNVGWDQATRAIDNGDSVDTETRNTSALPIEKHIYPSGNGPEINRSGGDNIAYPSSIEVVDSEEYTEPELPNGTSAYHPGNYSDQTSLRTTHLRSVVGEDAEIYGLVNNTPYVISDDEIEVTEVKKGNITVTHEEINRSQNRPTKVNLTLENGKTGERINHTEAGGDVIISDTPTDRTVDLGSDGKATVRTNVTGTIQAQYEPPVWTSSERPVTEDTDFTQSFRPPTVGGFVQWIPKILFRVLPIVLVMYMFNALRRMFTVGQGG